MKGKVFLIGAGPGDPGLITVKGLRCLRSSDVIVYDRLVDQRLLQEARQGAELVFVGKGPGERAMEQDDINLYLAERAREGRVVARLKGGDPFVFGRGGEEALALADVPFEVVPGVSSAIAAPAYAGIPLTHRELASSFTVVSGNEDPGKDGSAIRWDAIARSGGTLVLLMGWDGLDRITDTLMKEGMDASTPAALIHWGTEPYQQTVTGTLVDIATRGTEAGLSPPVVAVFGQVVDLRSSSRWFDTKPLFGKRVLVTRSRTQASALSQMLADEGAQPIELPTIELLPVEDWSAMDHAIAELHKYDWVIFTSTNGVMALFSRMRDLERDARALGGVRVAAIGPSTAVSLAQRGVSADFVPTEYVSEAVVEGMRDLGMAGSRVLLPRTDAGRPALAEGLVALGAEVDDVAVYRTVVPESSREKAAELIADGSVDVVTFTSSSTVLNTIELLGGDRSLLEQACVACIGPITVETARESGIHVDIVAQEYTIAGLVRAIIDYFAEKERH